MTNYGIRRSRRYTHIRIGCVTEEARGAGSIHRGGRQAPIAKGKGIVGGACEGIVGITETTAAGIATAGGDCGALKADIGMIRADQPIGASEGLIRVGGATSEAELERGLIDAGCIIRGLTLITAAPYQAQLQAQCSQNCKLIGNR